MHPRAVLQAGVHHRAELVHPSTQRRQDPLDRVTQRLLRGEAHIGPLDPAAAFHVDAVVSIHHHLLNCGVGEQLLQGAQADRLAKDQLAEASTGGGLEDRSVVVDQLAHRVGQGAQLASRSRLRAAALDQAAPQLGGELVQVPAADTIVHAGLSAQGGLLAPVVFRGETISPSLRRQHGRDRDPTGGHHRARGRRDRKRGQHPAAAWRRCRRCNLAGRRPGGPGRERRARADRPRGRRRDDRRRVALPVGYPRGDHGAGRPDLGRGHPQRDGQHPRQSRPARRQEPRAGRLRHRCRRIPAGGGSPGRGGGGAPSSREGSGLERIVFAVRGEGAEAAFRAAIS